MKTGKITAKLKDTVPVCLMVNGEEVKRYKNIELPDMLKEVEMTDFHFNVYTDGKITFEIQYEEVALPKVFPEARTRVSRAAKAAVKTTMQQFAEDEAAEATEPAVEDEPEESQPTDEPQAEAPGEAAAEETEPEGIEATYHVTGIRRKELVVAVSEWIKADPQYKAAPSFAYGIGTYTIDKKGTLTGPENPALIESLKEQGFIAAK